jgi:hypothetical protein
MKSKGLVKVLEKALEKGGFFWLCLWPLIFIGHKGPNGTAVCFPLEQDLSYSSYSRSIFSKYDELLNQDVEKKARLQSVMVADSGHAMHGRVSVGDRLV